MIWCSDVAHLLTAPATHSSSACIKATAQPASPSLVHTSQRKVDELTWIYTLNTNTKMLFLVAVAFSALSVVNCGNYTVTDEAWFDVEVKDLDGPGEDYRGRFTVALFGEAAPMTVMNFAAITRGYKRGGEKLWYKNSRIHRVVPDFVVQMGDITAGDGTGGKSIFGERFNDEDFILSHRSPGWVAMANHGKDTNGSQFYILLTKARWLDNKHVVFGKIIRGYNVIEVVGDVPSDPNTAVPRKDVRIVDCGLNNLDRKYELKPEQLDSIEDL